MMMVLLYIISVLIVFFGFAFYNYKQTDKSKTTPAAVAWWAASFWPIVIPIVLILWITYKGQKIFDDISENGLKDDTKRKSD
jgi:heme/copper-type cytochrome/quinol oxidase subunit 2